MRHNTFFGFKSLLDFRNTLFSIQYPGVVLVSSIIGALSSFITTFVYDSYAAVYTLLGMLVVDAISGIYRSVKEKRFAVEKLPRVLLIMTSYMVLLSVGFNLAKSSILWSFLPSTIYFGLSSVVLISILDNLASVGLIPPTLIKKLKSLIKKQDTLLDDQLGKDPIENPVEKEDNNKGEV